MNLSLVTKFAKSTTVQFLALILLAIIAFYLYVVVPSNSVLLDLSIFHEAGARFLAGENIYDHTYQKVARDGQSFSLYYFYPPLLAGVFSKLQTLSFDQIKIIWSVISYIALLGTVIMLLCLTNYSIYKQHSRLTKLLIILFFLLCFEPIYWGVMEGQVDAIILCLLTLFILLEMRQCQILSGIILSLAILIKMSPAVLLLAVIKLKHWKTLLSFGVTSVLLLGWIAVEAPSMEVYKDFFLPFGTLFSGALESRFVYNYALDRGILELLNLRHLSHLGFLIRGLLGILTVFIVLRHSVSDEKMKLRLFSALIIIMVLLSPTIWFQHLSWALIPIAILLFSETEINQDKYRAWSIGVGLYFALSQTNLLHYQAISNFPNLAVITAMIPSTTLLILLGILLKQSKLIGRAKNNS